MIVFVYLWSFQKYHQNKDKGIKHGINPQEEKIMWKEIITERRSTNLEEEKQMDESREGLGIHQVVARIENGKII